MPDTVTSAWSGRTAPRLLLLDSLFPGLGQLAAGRRRHAALFAIPVLVPILALLLLALITDRTVLAARLIDPAVLGALLLVQLLVLGWRLLSLAAVRLVTPFGRGAATILAAVLALVIVVGPQVALAGLTLVARDSATEVFAPVDEGGAWVPPADATPPAVASGDPDFGLSSPSPSVSPSPSPTPDVPRINVLLIGMDSGVGRNTALTDTMIVASLDPVTKTVSMVSVPRDTVDVPLPDGRTFRGKVNSLVSYVRWHPSKFPGAKDGQSVLAAALGKLLNLEIDLWAQVDLGGFINLVNSVGGITVNVTDGFCDPTYDEYGIDGFGVAPGRYRMNGAQALAYARVRKAAGESDFTRAARQQEVIAALRDKLVAGGFLNDPVGFLRSIGKTIRTNIKPSLLADWLGVATDVSRKDTFRVVIKHPLVAAGYDERGSIQIPDLGKIRAMAAKLFPPTGTRPTGFDTMPSAGSGAAKNAPSSTDCGIKPTPRPTPKPTPRATPGPTSTPAITPTPEPTPSPAEPTPSPAEPEPSPSS